MKTKVFFQRIPLEEKNVIDIDQNNFFSQCPHGFRANKSTFHYHFTDTHLILSCEIDTKGASTDPHQA